MLFIRVEAVGNLACRFGKDLVIGRVDKRDQLSFTNQTADSSKFSATAAEC